MVDIDLVVQQLRRYGHTVEHVVPVPENAGDWELTVDGANMPLEAVRLLLEREGDSAASAPIGSMRH
jgi:hypothetical protein